MSALRSPGRILLGVVAAVPVLAYLVVALQRIGYPYELTFFEGSTVEVTARVLSGEPLYGPPTTQFTPWPYPPLYFWVTALVADVVGTNLLALRLVSFVASLAVLVLVAVLVRRVGGSGLAGLAAAGLFAATYKVSGAWFDTARVDSLLLAFLLAMLLVAVRVRTWRGGVGLGVVTFAAFLTKQSALIVAVPLFAAMVWRRPRAGWAATVTTAVTVVGSTLVGDALTGGWYSRYVVTQLLGQAWVPDALWTFWVRDLAVPFAVTLAAIAVVGYARWRVGGGPRRWWATASRPDAYPVVVLVAGCAGLVGSAWAARLHEGGAENVLMPAYAAAALLTGVLVAVALKASWAGRAATALLAAGLAVQVGVLSLWQVSLLPTAEDRAAGDRFVADLQRLPRGVLVPTHPYYARLAGLPTFASAIALHDLYRTAGGPETLATALPWRLGGVSALVLDNTSDTAMFGDVLARDFTLVTDRFTPPDAFYPVSDLRSHPTLLYVRTTDLSQP